MELNSKIVAIVQARMGSSRLSGKVLMHIQGKPMLCHIVHRIKRVNAINEVVIATSDLSQDDPVNEMASEHKISCFRGSETDVLKRIHDAAELYQANHVIRFTGDCSLVDPTIVSKLIQLYYDGSYDFCGVACGAGVANQKNVRRFPDGLDAEIFSMQVLKEVHQEATDELHREHVTPFIWKNKGRYSLGTLYPEKEDYSHHRWTVDNEEDFEFIKWIYDMLYPEKKFFNLQDILALLSGYPDKQQKNKHLIGQEGYEEFWE